MTVTVTAEPYDHGLYENGDAPSGIYYLDDATRYLRVADQAARGDMVSLSPRRIAGWGRRKFFTLEKNEFARHRSFIQFPHLITGRMISLLLSYGVRIANIVQAHDYLRQETGDHHPFATRRLWTDDPDGVHVYAEINDVLLIADKFGQIPFAELLQSKIVETSNMVFDDFGMAVSWNPSPGVNIHPRFLSGAPRLEGRRIKTDQIAGMLKSGTSREDLMWWLEITETEIDAALRWEDALDEAEIAAVA